ncbi:unnamed protein product [Choristocarpus tenellus]
MFLLQHGAAQHSHNPHGILSPAQSPLSRGKNLKLKEEVHLLCMMHWLFLQVMSSSRWVWGKLVKAFGVGERHPRRVWVRIKEQFDRGKEYCLPEITSMIWTAIRFSGNQTSEDLGNQH